MIFFPAFGYMGLVSDPLSGANILFLLRLQRRKQVHLLQLQNRNLLKLPNRNPLPQPHPRLQNRLAERRRNSTLP